MSVAYPNLIFKLKSLNKIAGREDPIDLYIALLPPSGSLPWEVPPYLVGVTRNRKHFFNYKNSRLNDPACRFKN